VFSKWCVGNNEDILHLSGTFRMNTALCIRGGREEEEEIGCFA
jgi:hypothetical protein